MCPYRKRERRRELLFGISAALRGLVYGHVGILVNGTCSDGTASYQFKRSVVQVVPDLMEAVRKTGSTLLPPYRISLAGEGISKI